VIGWVPGECIAERLSHQPQTVLRMIREELQGSFSSIEVVVRRRGFGYRFLNSFKIRFEVSKVFKSAPDFEHQKQAWRIRL
jgi:hypothetical protein